MATLSKKKRKELEQLESEDTKYCEKCRKVKPLYEFSFNSIGRKFSQSQCIKCRNKYHRENQIFHHYGITLKEYDEMLKKQNGGCAICDIKIPGGNGRFHVDHDHKISGRKGIRGLLCNNCNHMLGHAKDNSETLAKAITYLKVIK